MGWLTFISNVISALAWPVTIVATVIMLLRNRKRVAQIIKSVRYKDIEVRGAKARAEVS
jgi:hypothetical protein